MTREENPDAKNTEQIVQKSSQSLSKQNTSLVRRGLQDLSALAVGRRKRVLVSHQEAIIEVVENCLSSAGYEVKTTTHASEVLALVSDFRPDLVLIQLIDSEIDGYRLSEQLATHFLRPNVVIVGPLYGERVQEKSAACDALDAPFSKEDLLNVVKTWVNRGSLQSSRREDGPRPPRFLVVSTEEAINEVIPDLLNRNGCIAIATGTKREDGWPVYEIVEEARAFQPDFFFLLHNLHLWPKMTGVDLPILLFENFPGASFLVGRFSDGQFTVSGEALAYAWNHSCRCETVNIPFEVDDILTKIGAWNAERGPTK
jgi:CheY-like chemotaxis protein